MMKQKVELPFTVSTDVTRPDTKTRRFMSHVMKRKNKGKSHHTQRSGTIVSTNARIADDADVPKHWQDPVISDYRPLGFIPKRVGSDLAFVPFSDEIDSSLAAPVIQCKPTASLRPVGSTLHPECFIKLANAWPVTLISKAALFPLESCMDSAEPP